MSQVYPPLNPTYRDIPNIGNWKGKVGGIKRLMAQPCSPDASIAALAMWQSAPVLIWSLFGPDCLDLVNDRAGGGHRRRRGISFREAGIIPGAGTGSGFGWAVFKIGSLGQRAGWYFTIADVGSDFVVNWMSLAMIYSGCSGGNNPYANGRQDPPGQNLIFPGIWVPLSFPTWDFGNGMVGAGSTVVFGSGIDASGTVSGLLAPGEDIPPPAGFQMRVVDVTADTTVWEGQGESAFGGPTLQTGGWYANSNFGGGIMQAQYKLLSGGVFTGSFNAGGIELNTDWPTITGAPCASNIKSDKNWSDYWKEFLDPLL